MKIVRNLDLLYCPAHDLNHVHAVSKNKKLAICSGCGEVVRKQKEIELRKEAADREDGSRYKYWHERRGKNNG